MEILQFESVFCTVCKYIYWFEAVHVYTICNKMPATKREVFGDMFAGHCLGIFASPWMMELFPGLDLLAQVININKNKKSNERNFSCCCTAFSSLVVDLFGMSYHSSRL